MTTTTKMIPIKFASRPKSNCPLAPNWPMMPLPICRDNLRGHPGCLRSCTFSDVRVRLLIEKRLIFVVVVLLLLQVMIIIVIVIIIIIEKMIPKKEEEPPAAAAAAAAPHHHHNTNNVRGVESQWTMRYLGRKLSWTAITTHSQRPHLIAWESTRESILRNKGRVQFVSRSATAARSPTTTTTPPTTTCMKLTMSFTLPRFLARWHVLQRSSTIQHFIEHRMLQTTLQNFRDIVVTHDLPQSAWEEEEEASSSSSSSWRETTTTTRPRPRQHEQ